MPEHPLRDKYANIATFDITQGAANAIVFGELLTGAGIDSGRRKATAILIDEIDYFPYAAAIAQMTTAGDDLFLGLTVSDQVTALSDVSDSRILHAAQYTRFDFGTAASGAFFRLPFVYQFFPALITAERRIYLGFDSTGLAAAQSCRARMYYRTVEITEGEFIELAEVFRLVG